MPCFISEEGIDELQELLRPLNALDMLELFHQMGINVGDFNDLDVSDFVDLGLSQDRAQELYRRKNELQQKENERKNDLNQTLKDVDCIEFYDDFIKAGYTSEKILMCEKHDDLKDISLSFTQRKNILKKIQNAKGNLLPRIALIIILFYH